MLNPIAALVWLRIAQTRKLARLVEEASHSTNHFHLLGFRVIVPSLNEQFIGVYKGMEEESETTVYPEFMFQSS